MGSACGKKPKTEPPDDAAKAQKVPSTASASPSTQNVRTTDLNDEEIEDCRVLFRKCQPDSSGMVNEEQCIAGLATQFDDPDAVFEDFFLPCADSRGELDYARFEKGYALLLDDEDPGSDPATDKAQEQSAGRKQSGAPTAVSRASAPKDGHSLSKEDEAARKIQAIQRGRQQRQSTAALRQNAAKPSQPPGPISSIIPETPKGSLAAIPEAVTPNVTRTMSQEDAAMKIQAIQRGRQQRRATTQLRQQRAVPPQIASVRSIPPTPKANVNRTMSQEDAAMRIQAIQRGRQQRRATTRLRHERSASLVSPQSASTPVDFPLEPHYAPPPPILETVDLSPLKNLSHIISVAPSNRQQVFAALEEMETMMAQVKKKLVVEAARETPETDQSMQRVTETAKQLFTQVDPARRQQLSLSQVQVALRRLGTDGSVIQEVSDKLFMESSRSHVATSTLLRWLNDHTDASAYLIDDDVT